MSAVPPILVIGYGNPSRGDDAVGPLLAERLLAWLEDAGIDEVEVLTDFQLSIEHALDLEGRTDVLLIDASLGEGASFGCAPVLAVADASYTTHAVSPGGLLEIYRRLSGRVPPPVALLSIPGKRFELGEALSAEAGRCMEDAWRYIQDWCLSRVGSRSAANA